MKTIIHKSLLQTVLFLSGLFLFSYCAVQQNIGNKKYEFTPESLNAIKPKTVYTFYFNDNSKLRVKVSKNESEVITGIIRSGNQHNKIFEITFEDIIHDVKSITTVSGKGIAGNLLIGGGVIVAAYVAALLGLLLVLAMFGL